MFPIDSIFTIRWTVVLLIEWSFLRLEIVNGNMSTLPLNYLDKIVILSEVT